MYAKARIDALTDGIFAVAMTILVLDVRLPDEFRLRTRRRSRARKQLWPKVFPYLLSFHVLGNSWLSMVRLRSRGDYVDRRYAVWWLFTCARDLPALLDHGGWSLRAARPIGVALCRQHGCPVGDRPSARRALARS
jgi:hypothetical protein